MCEVDKNNPTKALCTCYVGYRGNGERCVDVDECSENSHTCDLSRQKCINQPGSFTCQCRRGYQPAKGNKCEDIDECKTQTHNCAEYAVCTNTKGGFVCACPANFIGDGRYVCLREHSGFAA